MNMRCRAPGCRARSKGPRFHFMCPKHMTLPEKKQRELLAKHNSRNGSPPPKEIVPKKAGASGFDLVGMKVVPKFGDIEEKTSSSNQEILSLAEGLRKLGARVIFIIPVPIR